MHTFSSLTIKESWAFAERIDFRKIAGREILITGASGMVGSFLTSALIAGCQIQGLPLPKISLLVRNIRSDNLLQFLGQDHVTIIETNISQWSIDKAYEMLIHAASPASPTKYGDAESIIDTNVGFLENLAKQIMPKTTLFVSSGEVYGTSPPLGVAETQKLGDIPEGPRAVYPQAKIAAERLLSEMGAGGQTEPLVARLFHSFGPGLRREDGRSFGDFLWSAAQGRDIRLLSPGGAIRTFLYLEDAVAGLLTVLTRGVSGETYNVASEEPMTILDFATAIAEVARVKVGQSADFEQLKTDYVHSPNATIVPSNRKLRELGWTQKVSLQEGISRSLEWIELMVRSSRT